MDDFIGGNNYRQTEDQQKTKKLMKIIIIILVLLFILCIALVGVMYYFQTTQLKITLDGASRQDLQNVLVFENGKIYVPIRAFANIVSYESSNGGYKQYTEDTTKCYVQNKYEVANFTLDSNKVSKIVLDGENITEYYEIDEPVRMINNQLYTTAEGAEVAFNISILYDQESNSVTIYSLPYLVAYYTANFQNSGIAEENIENFSNQKALLYNMLVVKNEEDNYGVYSIDGKEILGIKYAKVKFIESAKEFLVTTLENKVGIMLYDSTIKISPEYDDIKQIDINKGLYLVKKSNKQGVVNSNGSIVIHLEYDQIGVNSSVYTADIENQYLLYNKCIPVRLGTKWGLFDTTGMKLTEVQYDGLGCTIGNAMATTQNTNNLLLVPKYEGIVVKQGELYGLIDSNGTTLIQPVLTSMYSITSAGETTYYMTTATQQLNVISYIETYVINANNNTNPPESGIINNEPNNNMNNEQINTENNEFNNTQGNVENYNEPNNVEFNNNQGEVQNNGQQGNMQQTGGQQGETQQTGGQPVEGNQNFEQQGTVQQ